MREWDIITLNDGSYPMSLEADFHQETLSVPHSRHVTMVFKIIEKKCKMAHLGLKTPLNSFLPFSTSLMWFSFINFEAFHLILWRNVPASLCPSLLCLVLLRQQKCKYKISTTTSAAINQPAGNSHTRMYIDTPIHPHTHTHTHTPSTHIHRHVERFVQTEYVGRLTFWAKVIAYYGWDLFNSIAIIYF